MTTDASQCLHVCRDTDTDTGFSCVVSPEKVKKKKRPHKTTCREGTVQNGKVQVSSDSVMNSGTAKQGLLSYLRRCSFGCKFLLLGSSENACCSCIFTHWKCKLGVSVSHAASAGKRKGNWFCC